MFTFAYNFAFVGSLILLFNDFARRTYGKKKAAAAIEEKAAAKKSVKTVKIKAEKAPVKAEKEEKAPVKAAKATTKASKTTKAAPAKSEKATRVSRKSAAKKEDEPLPEIVISQPATPPRKKRATSTSKSRGPARRRSTRTK